MIRSLLRLCSALAVGTFLGLSSIDVASAAATTCQGVTISPASSDRLLCSKNFYASGTCTGGDVLAKLADNAGFPNTQFVTPWELGPISIVGISFLDLQGNLAAGYVLAGNSYTPDIMAAFSGNRANTVFFPSGMSFQFPGPSATPPHIDLHTTCAPGSNFQGFYTIFYTVP